MLPIAPDLLTQPQVVFAEKERVHMLPKVSCDCSKCRRMCHVAPCIGTPADMHAIVKAGYGHKLAPTTYAPWIAHGIAPVDLVAPRMTPKGCAFLTPEGLCELHDKGLKPTEGRVISCKTSSLINLAVPMRIADMWR